MLTEDDLQRIIAELAPGIARDPRVRPTIRIGAIGHRAISEAVQIQVSTTVSNVLRTIREAAVASLQHPGVREQFAHGLDLVIVSPLAEGADRIIARAGIGEGYVVGAILPFPLSDYEATFDCKTDSVIAEFLRLLGAAELPGGFGILVLDGDAAPEHRDAAFMACANAVTRWSDILVAIFSEEHWTSHSALSAREAMEQGVPVVQIDPSRPDVFVLWIRGVRTDEREAGMDLGRYIRTLLAPSNLAAAEETARAPGSALSPGFRAYLDERVRCDLATRCDLESQGPYETGSVGPFWVGWCAGLNRWIEGRLLALLDAIAPAGAAAAGAPEASVFGLPFDRPAMAQSADLFLRYQRADTLAGSYSELHRSAQIVIVLLGIATVVFALLNASNRVWSSVFAGLEFGCLVLALAFAWIAHRQAWLDRWLNYRLLAEIFRYSRFLLLTGEPAPFVDLRGPYVHENLNRAWARDHVRHVLRAHRIAVPGRGCAAKIRALPLLREYFVSRCIDDQIAYHEATGPARSRFGEALKRLSLFCSIVTILCVGTKFALALARLSGAYIAVPFVMSGVNIAAVVAPAITGAVLALRAYGEHDVVAVRSAGIAANLRDVRLLVEQAHNLAGLGEATLRVVRLLLREVDGWIDLFADKHLE